MKNCSSHNYRYLRDNEGHEHLSCNRCGTVFFDSRNQLSSQEKRELTYGIISVLVGLPFLWAFIWLIWVSFG